MTLIAIIQKLLLTLVAALGFAVSVFITLVLTGKIVAYHSPEFGNWAMWVGALATVFAAIGTVGTLAFIILDNKYKAKLALSKASLDEQKEIINGLVSVLKDRQLSTEEKWVVIENTYYRLNASYIGILDEVHIKQAKSNYLSVIPYLESFYYKLEQHDFLPLPKGLKLQYPLTANNSDVTIAAEILASSWIKYVAGKTSFYEKNRFENYEVSSALEKNFALILIAFLCHKSHKPLDIDKLNKNFKQLYKHNYLKKWDISLEINRKYSALFAHLLLCETYSAKRYNYNGKKTIPIPSLHVYAPEKTWVKIGSLQVTYPNKLSHVKQPRQNITN
ncbi:hypothetical protein MT391_06120 [Vibrio sp. 1-Bac 57]